VILIDEFSTGIDAKMKREMWRTLQKVAEDKAVVITTHSMEEASALANQVGIIERQMLALGTPRSLLERYAQYQVHFTCRTRDDVIRAQALMSRIPGAKLAEDVATRFEVPIVGSQGETVHHRLRLAQLFRMLCEHEGGWEYSVEKATLENIFLQVIRGQGSRDESN
jgi:ATP-binding cassette subfamily A (ABC1) protein 3